MCVDLHFVNMVKKTVLIYDFTQNSQFYDDKLTIKKDTWLFCQFLFE